MKSHALSPAIWATAGLIGMMPAASLGEAHACGPAEKIVIDAEARCFDSGGIDIGYMDDEGVKVACLRDRRMQSVCGPDGRLTRLHAYREWFAKLKRFENSCSARGGTFSYEDPYFLEPTDEAFCMRAQPEIGSTMFESATCNFRAICPATTVICEFGCRGDRLATPPSSPPSAEDASLLKRIAQKR